VWYILITVRHRKKQKKIKGEKIMTNYSINTNWYYEIKGIVPMENPYFITDGPFAGQVEVDVLDVEKFKRVSTEMGWM
jgi:hypothetical protein